MLKAYDISANWPKAVDPGGTGIPPVVSGILPETGAPPALVPATSGFPLAVARQFPGGHPPGGRPPGPESDSVRPGQTFEILKIAGHGDRSGAFFPFFIFHFPFKPVAVRKDPESGSVRPGQTFEILKIARHGDRSGAFFSFFIFHFPFKPVAVRKDPESGSVRPGQTFEILKIARHGKMARLPKLLRRPFIFHSSFSIFHLKIGGLKVIQGCSRLNFFLHHRGAGARLIGSMSGCPSRPGQKFWLSRSSKILQSRILFNPLNNLCIN